MNKKKIFLIVSWIYLLVITVGAICYLSNKTTYKLNLPLPENLTDISLKQNTSSVIIEKNEEIKDIVDVIGGVKRTTKRESVQDFPIDADNVIQINFNLSDSGVSVMFLYRKNNKYYIEQPYSGIYRISADEYNSIAKYIN